MNIHSREFFNSRIWLVTILLNGLLILNGSLNRAFGSVDTTFSVTFNLNMTKAIHDGIFNPGKDLVYIVPDQGFTAMQLVPGPNMIYTATLFDILDSGVTYHYKFRIGDTITETVNRSFKAKQGMVTISTWWNQDPMNFTTFTVDMKWAAQAGIFDPLHDSVCINGTMSNVRGFTKLTRYDTTLQYSITYSLNPYATHSYRYFINADSSRMELAGKPDRKVLIPDTLLIVMSDFNNVNPGTRPMTFKCNMEYYLRKNHFDPSKEFLEVTGNFNEWGDNDYLFKNGTDSVYSVDLALDTNWFHSGPLEFKFRITGDSIRTELAGKPFRTFSFQDTLTGHKNSYSCYFNDLDPAVPTRPWVYNVAIQGILIHKEVLSGIYTFEDVNGAREDTTQYQWYRSTDAQGNSRIPIDTARSITYTIDTLDIGHWLVFEVTPIAAKTDSAFGLPVRVVSATPVGGVGIDEMNGFISRVYPNPSSDLITVETRKKIRRLEILSLSGRSMLVADDIDTQAIRLSIGRLAPGAYLIHAITPDGESGTARLIRQ